MIEFLEIVLPILLGLIGIIAQRQYLKYKTTRFKLKDHPLFNDLLTDRRNINSWNVKENRQVFLDALTIKLNCWRKEGLLLAEQLQKGDYSNKQLINIVSAWANEVIVKYTAEWAKEGVPVEVINRITKIHNEKVDQFFMEIRDIAQDNDMYPFKMQKAIAIFGTLRLLLTDTKNDFNRLVYREVYNGDFTDVSYRGIPVSDTEYEQYKLDNE